LYRNSNHSQCPKAIEISLAAFCAILQITQSLQTTQSTIKIYSHPEYFNIGTYHGNWDHL